MRRTSRTPARHRALPAATGALLTLSDVACGSGGDTGDGSGGNAAQHAKLTAAADARS
ncbi:hypothetical protein [Streptomyces sp. JJ36]|uniref:hypothetical protein n=1 Tax=Streptomyces sp. JJ36 TaxID=2736645 RepID=UPI001F435DD1|nr:hypothetical protein [Streptomyces sp. JJ36]MCF6522222.1 hypothetical protein [Streptomyces sp. JJ36]